MNRRRLMGGDLHEYVDLGLPSGTLWATCNIGAKKPEDYGWLCIWGSPTDVCAADDNARSPYLYPTRTSIQSYLHTVSKESLPHNKLYDTAYYYLGQKWSLPTKEQVKELYDYTEYSYVTNYKNSGINGVLFETWLPGEDEDIYKCLFIPYTGHATNSKWELSGKEGLYMTNTPFSTGLFYAFGGSTTNMFPCNILLPIYYMYPVRPVISGGGKLTFWKRILRLFKKGGGVC